MNLWKTVFEFHIYILFAYWIWACVDGFVSTSSHSLILLLPSIAMQYVNFTRTIVSWFRRIDNELHSDGMWIPFVIIVCISGKQQQQHQECQQEQKFARYIYIDSVVSSALIWLSLDEVKFFFSYSPFFALSPFVCLCCAFFMSFMKFHKQIKKALFESKRLADNNRVEPVCVEGEKKREYDWVVNGCSLVLC